MCDEVTSADLGEMAMMCSLVRKENHPMGIKWQTSAQTVLSDVHNPHNSTVRWGTIGPISQMSKQRQQRGQGTCPRMHSYTLVPPPHLDSVDTNPRKTPLVPCICVSREESVCRHARAQDRCALPWSRGRGRDRWEGEIGHGPP